VACRCSTGLVQRLGSSRRIATSLFTEQVESGAAASSRRGCGWVPQPALTRLLMTWVHVRHGDAPDPATHHQVPSIMGTCVCTLVGR
jgi:hypothetical protein